MSGNHAIHTNGRLPADSFSAADWAALVERLDSLTRPRLLVLGDLMLDRYALARPTRISPEAPVPVYSVARDEVRAGGAASVAVLARGLGADVDLVGVVGDDSDAKTLDWLLATAGIDRSGVLAVERRRTTTKERVVALSADGGQQAAQHVARLDRETTAPLAEDIAARLAACVAERLPRCQALLISDYGKGCCTPGLLRAAIRTAQHAEKPVLVDPARSSDWRAYGGATLVKCNRAEAELVLGEPLDLPGRLERALDEIRSQTQARHVVVTLDGQGLVCDGRRYPTRRRRPLDITGAGDMALAALGLALVERWPIDAALRLANVAAGLEVERLGVQPVSRLELRAELARQSPHAQGKIVSLDVLEQLIAEHRRQGQRIALTNGCFDLALHQGHLVTLQEAAAQGDVLVVAINSDASVRCLKGRGRPVVPQDRRAALLAALACVDYVVVFDESTPHAVLRRLRPDVLVKGGSYTPEQVVGREVVESFGGAVHVASHVQGVSTTALLSGAVQRPELVEST
jgi:D-beta-D-heptose 7-phosphate kinase/D-beta-D-heptose 1-phosphate adenosyltransferase